MKNAGTCAPMMVCILLLFGCSPKPSEFDAVLDKFDEMVGVYESYTKKDPFCVEYVVQLNGEVLVKLNDVAAKAKRVQESGPAPNKDQTDRYIRISTRMSTAMLALGERMKAAKMCGNSAGATGPSMQVPATQMQAPGPGVAAEATVVAPNAVSPPAPAAASEAAAPVNTPQAAAASVPPQPVSGEAPRPSFDCARASTPVERMICASAELSRLDAQLADLYGKARTGGADPEQLKTEQIAWIRQSRKCADEGCVAQSYKSRIVELARLVR